MKRSSGAAQVPLGDAEGYGSLGAHRLATSRAPGTERRRGAEGDLAGRGVLCYVKAACLNLGHARSRAQAVDGAYRLHRSSRIAFNALVSPPWSFGGEEHLPLEVPSRGPGRELVGSSNAGRYPDRYLDWHLKSLRSAGQHEVLLHFLRNQLKVQKEVSLMRC